MSEIAKRETLETVRTTAEATETGEGMRLAQGRFLDELPGAAFGVVTLIWVIASFAGLMWQNLPADLIAHVRAISELVVGSRVITVVARGSAVASVGKKVYDAVNRNSA
jgi:hypothetical protein